MQLKIKYINLNVQIKTVKERENCNDNLSGD